ncbi:MAG TPA: PHB depolymerase family esterase [Polyangiales bacterium]|nr:PHB depolymerase family esterase [Polyangiales bacterium]
MLLTSLGCSDDSGSDPMGATGAGSGAPAPACSGKPGALRGRSMQALMAGGLNRSFLYYAPPTLDPNTPAPVVIVPHGFMMTADMMFEITRYSELADREKIIVLFPNGQPAASLLDGPWNVGAPECASSLGVLPVAKGDDNAFIDAMLSFAEADQCLDRSHIFMTGFSMGGYFSNHTGCVRPDIRAVAPHSGGVHDLSMCTSMNKPVLVMHFEGDALIPYNCGSQARDRWVALNKCQAAGPMTTPVKSGRCEYYNGCQAGGQVGMCSFMIPAGRSEPYPGHAWSGGSKDGAAGGANFAIPETESATELSWAFFKKYAW